MAGRVRRGHYRGGSRGGGYGVAELVPLARLAPSVYLARGEIIEQIVGHSHQEQLRQLSDEDGPHPRRHLVSARLAVVHVQYDNRYHDRQPDQDHREE